MNLVDRITPLDPSTGQHRRTFALTRPLRQEARINAIEGEWRRAEQQAVVATCSKECSGYGMPEGHPKHRQCTMGPRYCLCHCHDPECFCAAHAESA